MPDDLIRREAKLRQNLRKLTAQQARYENRDAALADMRKERLPVDKLELGGKTWLDGKTWYVSTGQRHLPQGGPTSPAITNILCRRTDAPRRYRR